MRQQPSQPIAKPLREAALASQRRRSAQPAKQADAGSLQWQRALHPKVRQFLDAAGKLDWSKLP